ncbi:MAG TPA: hypothetical protein VGX76_23440, partial [Pirellulales bacterium]|nr:hypothetical protein [Pirellulales bacterium]
FVEQVCDLSGEQRAALRGFAWSAFDRVAERIAARVVQNGQPNQRRLVKVVNGRAVAVPAVLEQELVASPHEALRWEFSRILEASWPDAWKKFDAERRRLAARRKEASIAAQVAALDEALWLSSRQRKDLCELLAAPMADAWWQPNPAGQVFTSVQQLQAALAGNSLGTFSIPEASLAELMRPGQLETFNQLQQPKREEWVMVDQPAPKAAVKAPPGMAPPQRVARRVVRRGPPLEDQQKRLTEYVAHLVDDIDASCGLSQPQREKLRLAGTLDIAEWKERLPPPEKLPEGQEVVIQNVPAPGPSAPLPTAIFTAPSSYFQKTLVGRLLDEQTQKRSAAERERVRFQQQSMVAALVAGYERAAALTSAQCEKLSSILNEGLGASESKDWRMDCLRRLVQVPVESLDRICLDSQRSAAGQHRSQLLNVPVQVEAGLPR